MGLSLRSALMMALSVVLADSAMQAQSEVAAIFYLGQSTDTGLLHERARDLADGQLIQREDGTWRTWLQDPVFISEYKSNGVQPFAGAQQMRLMRTDGPDYAAILNDGRVNAFLSGQIFEFSPLAPGNYVAISIGNGNAYLIHENGELHGVSANYSIPIWPDALLPPGIRYTQIESGTYFAVALRSDGNVESWVPSWGTSSIIPPLPPETTYTAIAVGSGHIALLRSDGRVVMLTPALSSMLNVPELPQGMTYTGVGISKNGPPYAVAIRSDGRLIAWGDNSANQLSVPEPNPESPYVKLSLNENLSVAMRADGTIATWIQGTDARPAPPSQEPGIEYTKIQALGPFLQPLTYFGLTSGGMIETWGEPHGWLSNPVGLNDVGPPPPGTRYVDIQASSTHLLALISDGTVVGWGLPSANVSAVPVLPAGLTYTAIGATENGSLALRSDGELVGWGSTSSLPILVPQLPPGLTYTSFRAYGQNAVAKRSDGAWVFWGVFAQGVNVLPSGINPQDVADIFPASNVHIMLLHSGQAISWTIFPGPQIDIPPLPPSVTYKQFVFLPGAVAALRSDGSLVSWGSGLHIPGLFAPQPPLTAPELLPGWEYTELIPSHIALVLKRSRKLPLKMLPETQTVTVGQELRLDLVGFSLSPFALMVDTVPYALPLSNSQMLGVPFPSLVTLDGTGYLSQVAPGATILSTPLRLSHSGHATYLSPPIPPELAGTTLFIQALSMDPNQPHFIALSTHGVASQPTPSCRVQILP
jgi:hypothetical protein